MTTISATIIADSMSPDGIRLTTMRACSKCGQDRPVAVFQHFRGRPSGQCRDCKTESMKAARLASGTPVRRLSRLEADQKLCLQCEEMQPVSAFAPTARGLGGVSAYCRSCILTRYPSSREQRRGATAAYRKRHPERWAALHRLAQFRRRTARDATSDGSVTDAFLVALYATERCAYCGSQTPRDQRTAEHLTPLARGGVHQASNLTMACRSCNSAKGARTLEEFMEAMK